MTRNGIIVFVAVGLALMLMVSGCDEAGNDGTPQCGRGLEGDSCRSTTDCDCGLRCINLICVSGETIADGDTVDTPDAVEGDSTDTDADADTDPDTIDDDPVDLENSDGDISDGDIEDSDAVDEDLEASESNNETKCIGSAVYEFYEGEWRYIKDCSNENLVCRDGECVCETTEAASACYDGDVYWYDCRGIRQAKKDECDDCPCSGNVCETEYAACHDGDVYWFGCRGTVSRKKAECSQYECSEGKCQVDLPWISIPGGTFDMGCVPHDEDCNANEMPRHEVVLTDFQMTETEITQEQYVAVMGDNPSLGVACGANCPVDSVEWIDAKSFCEAVGGRLPSEAEWEYAARAGNATIYVCGDDPGCLDEVAWYAENSNGVSHPVGLKSPNAFGLYDMGGNVSEWVADCWHENYSGAPGTGNVWSGGDCAFRIYRYSDWRSQTIGMRLSMRVHTWVDGGSANAGFRCIRDMEN